MRQKRLYLKAQKCSKFHRPHVRINCSPKSESVSFSLNVLQLFYRPWLIVLKGEFNFELKLYITIFVF